ncbi:MAG: TetR/AcrR family transcriptional regulator [Hyphomicrobiaceae bacterium]
MTSDTTTRDLIIDTALKLAEERPWTDVLLRDIAREAGIDLAAMQGVVSNKDAIIAAFIRRIDQQMLSESRDVSTDQSPRDALFEVIMNRFDALAPHKPALKSIVGPKLPDPDLLRAFLQSQGWILQAAGVDPVGLKGGVRVAGLLGLYSTVFQTWLDDDDPGLARTMAVLDRRLRRGERVLKRADNVVDMAEGLCRTLYSMLPTRLQSKQDGQPSSEPELDTRT